MGEQGQGGFNPQIIDYLRKMGLFGGAAGAAGGFANYFSKGKNPSDVANGYLDQIPGQTQQYYQPYQQGGLDAYNKLHGEYGNLIDDPSAAYNKLAGGFKESPGYKFQLQQAMNASNNANAAGGSLGTPQHQEQSQDYAHGLASQDFENYLGHTQGLYEKGLGGYEHQSDQGFQANTDYANMIASILGQKAQYGYAGAAGENARKSSARSSIFKGLGTLGGSLFGGPVGGAAGEWIGGKLGGG